MPQEVRQRSIPFVRKRNSQSLDCLRERNPPTPHFGLGGLCPGMSGYQAVGMDFGEH